MLQRFAVIITVLSVNLTAWSHAQVVDIPDPNLRAAVMERLQLGAPPTQADMLRLTDFRKHATEIESLLGLEYAVNLKRLDLEGNRISDLTPLSNLQTLEVLRLNWNQITDISALANLTSLRVLAINNNLITDVEALSGLTKLREIAIQNNFIVDHSPLDGLTLDVFTYDQICDMPREPLEPRLTNRSFPSIFGPGGAIVNKSDYWIDEIAQHDLYLSWGPAFGEQDTGGEGFRQINGEWHITGDMVAAQHRRDHFRSLNPNLVILYEIQYYRGTNLPEDSPYWFRRPSGEIVVVEGTRLINYTLLDVQDMIVGKALAVAKCGLYDGLFFDIWHDEVFEWDNPLFTEEARLARLEIIRRIREQVGEDFLIVGNTNDRIIPLTGPFMNAGIMEAIVPSPHVPREPSIRVVRDSLEWLATNLREPRLPMLQGGTDRSEPPDSPYNQRLMRATTTMSLTHSDGYVQFTIDTSHDTYWYDFWDVDLGQPVGPKFQFYENIEGLYIREFDNGWAVYNQSGEAQVVTLPEEVQSVANGRVNTEHTVLNIDGDIFLKVEPRNPADLNGDGIVNILDLTLVAQAMGTDMPEADVNGDGVVNVFDLVFVANQF